MKKYIIILLIFAALFFSCKKEETPTPSNSSTSTPPADGSVSTATSYYGILKSEQIVSITGSANTVHYSYNFPSAYFSVSPMQYQNSATAIEVDSVLLNDNKFYYSSYSYSSPTSSIVYPPSTWKIYGKNGIPGFTYVNNDALPIFTGYNQFPDSISKAANYTFTVSGLSGFNEATLILSDASNIAGHYVAKSLSASTTSVTFTVNEMAAMNTISNAIFSLVLVKNNVRYFGGKSFNFPSEVQYTKTIKLY